MDGGMIPGGGGGMMESMAGAAQPGGGSAGGGRPAAAGRRRLADGGSAGGAGSPYGSDGHGRRLRQSVDPANGRYVDDKNEPLTGDRLRTAIKSDQPADAFLAVAKRMPMRDACAHERAETAAVPV